MIDFKYAFMLFSLLFVFSTTSIWSFACPKLSCERQLNNIFFLLSLVILFIIVIFRDGRVLPDYNGYVGHFNTINLYGEDGIKSTGLEKSLVHIANIVIKYFNADIFFFFFIYAIISVLLKIIAIKLNTGSISSTLLVYISFFYILHDFIQIRIAAAMTFILFALYFRNKKQYIVAIVFYLISLYFHYSAIFYGIIFFLSDKSINGKFYFITMILSFIIPIFNINVMSIFSIPIFGIFSEKLRVYSHYRFERGDIINIPKIIRLFFGFVIIYKNNLLQKNPNNIIFIKLYLISIIVQQLFYYVPVIPTRVSELYRVNEIFVLPVLRTCFKEKLLFNFIFIFY
jgi:hypothetical protein